MAQASLRDQDRIEVGTRLAVLLVRGGYDLHWAIWKVIYDRLRRNIQSVTKAEPQIETEVFPEYGSGTKTLWESAGNHGMYFGKLFVEVHFASPECLMAIERGILDFVQSIAQVGRNNSDPINRVKRKVIKRGEQYELSTRRLWLVPEVFEVAARSLSPSCKCHLKHLQVVKPRHGDGKWWPQLCCVICGQTYVCECFRKAIEIEQERSDSRLNAHSNAVRRPRKSEKVDKIQFRHGICSLCTGVQPPPSHIGENRVRSFYLPYIRKFKIEEQVSYEEAENKARQILGLPQLGERWATETKLYEHVKKLFPKTEVKRQATFNWLGRQRLDIFLPELKLAIEYQGEQHSEPFDHWGGIPALRKRQQLDNIKRRSCKRHHIDIVYFDYREDLSLSNIKMKLSRWRT